MFRLILSLGSICRARIKGSMFLGTDFNLLRTYSKDCPRIEPGKISPLSPEASQEPGFGMDSERSITHWVAVRPACWKLSA